MTDDYRDHPKSLNEVKAEKSHNGAKWTPRDALISLLREIDNGLDIEMLIVGYRYKSDKDTNEYRYHQSTPNLLTAIGLWHMTGELLKNK